VSSTKVLDYGQSFPVRQELPTIRPPAGRVTDETDYFRIADHPLGHTVVLYELITCEAARVQAGDRMLPLFAIRVM
jgi:hypothetical protein